MKENICRVCLKPGEIMISLYEYDDASSKYADQIKYCANIDITELDGYPSDICNDCRTELSTAYCFVLKCQNSDRLLRESKSDVEVKIEPDLSGNLSDRSCGDRDYGIEQDAIEELEKSVMKLPKLKLPKLKSLKKKMKVKKHKKVKIKKENTELQCATCGLIVASRSAMVIHLRSHTGERPYQCVHCGARFSQMGTLKVHTGRRHSARAPDEQRPRPFPCEHCKSRFFTQRDLTMHVRTHTGEAPHACSFCGRRFTQLGSLIRHRRTHTGERPFRCPDARCSKAFKDRSMLRQHRLVHSEEKRYRCEECGKAVKSRNTLNKHLSLHRVAKPVMCEQCGAAFSTVGNLASHARRQHGRASGTCEDCGRHCADLEEHRRRHTGEALYACPLCAKRFTLRRSLSVHMHKHTNADKFRCEHENCLKSFSLKYLLDFHRLKYHTSETPFICKICAKGFLRIGDLKRHSKIHHPNFSFVP